MMHIVQIQDRQYAQFERLRGEAGLVHAFSTRPADMSLGANPDEPFRRQRRRALAEDWGLDAGRLCFCQQVHGRRIAVITRARPGGRLARCDAVVTNRRAVPLMTFSADCPLVLIHDPVRGVLGLVHASWRCTVAAVTRRTVELMAARFASQPADLRAGIGPGAGPCCYEVRDNVYAAAARLGSPDRIFLHCAGRLYFDLWEANRVQLLEGGVPDAHIETAGICTMCHNELFYSYRREGKSCGHFALLAALPPPGATAVAAGTPATFSGPTRPSRS